MLMTLLMCQTAGRESALNGPTRGEIAEAARVSSLEEEGEKAEAVSYREWLAEAADQRRRRRAQAASAEPEPPVRYVRECPVCGAPVGQPCPAARLGKAAKRGETEHKERKHVVLRVRHNV